MSCNDNWTIKFPEANGFEVRPIEMELRISRTKYDYCSAEFSFEAMEQMKPETRNSDGLLNDINAVEVLYNGQLAQKLMFRGDWVKYGDKFAEVELKDLHKSLSDGEIDLQRKSLTLKDAYKKIINEAERDMFGDSLDDSNFTLPESQVRTVYGQAAIGYGNSQNFRLKERAEADITKKVLDSTYAIDIEGESPERAIQILNKTFNIHSWVNREGKLMIGVPEAKRQITHVAAPDDSRVWRFKNPNITHNREPIHRVVVEGAWVDTPGIGGGQDFIDEIGNWFDDNNSKGAADDRAMGYAENQDVDYGKTFAIKSTKAKRDALEKVAELAMIERMKENNSGEVGIDPVISGDEISSPIDATPGDLLQMVPEDDYFEEIEIDSGSIDNPLEDTSKVCGGYVNNEIYLISEVEHEIDRLGDWNINLRVSLFPQSEIKTYTDYWRPDKGDDGALVDEENLEEDGSLSDDGLFGFGIIEEF